MYDREATRRLWTLSEERTGVEYDPPTFERFAVRKQNPEAWHLRTVRP